MKQLNNSPATGWAPSAAPILGDSKHGGTTIDVGTSLYIVATAEIAQQPIQRLDLDAEHAAQRNLGRVRRGRFSSKRAPSSVPEIPIDELAVIHSFLNGGAKGQDRSVFINITAMCRAFGKHAGRYLALRQTKNFIGFWARTEEVPSDSLVTRTGATPKPMKPDAWAHRRVAVECARWLSPRFDVWFMDRDGFSNDERIPYVDILEALAEVVEAEAKVKAKLLEDFRRQLDPDRISGFSGRLRKVRCLGHGQLVDAMLDIHHAQRTTDIQRTLPLTAGAGTVRGA